HYGLIYGVGYYNGRFAPLQQKQHKLLDNLLARHDTGTILALGSVDYVVSANHPVNENLQDDKHFTEIARDPDFNLRIFRVNTTAPRAYLAPNPIYNPDVENMFKILAQDFTSREL